jgi:hypothetical protein
MCLCKPGSDKDEHDFAETPGFHIKCGITQRDSLRFVILLFLRQVLLLHMTAVSMRVLVTFSMS